MKTRKFSLIFILFSIFSFSSAYAMQTEEEVKSWTPQRLHPFAKEIKEQINSEKHLKTLREEGDHRDFGLSFAYVTHSRKLCLMKICELSSQTQSRIPVLDLGAGHGLMAWKMVLAGAHVTAIEHLKPTATLLQKGMMQVKPYLVSNETVQSVCKIVWNDMFKENLKCYQISYDLTWSGNVIHLLTPSEAMNYVKNLYKITKPGGYAMANVMAPSNLPQLVTYFLQEKEKNNLTPGFLVADKNDLRYMKKGDNMHLCRGVELTGTFYPASPEMSPTELKMGYYGKEEKEDDHYFDFQGGGRELTFKQKMHGAMHFFDTDSFSCLFREAGFEVEDVFYENSHGHHFDGALSVEGMSKGAFSVALIARKPL